MQISPDPRANRTDRYWPIVLADALARLGEFPYGGHVPVGLTDHIVSQLGQLPPQTVSWAGYRVAAEAKLWAAYPAAKSIADFFQRRSTPLDWLRSQPHLAPVFLFHGSGFVREAALRAMVRLPDSPFFVAALFWRMNDWVAEVRATAQAQADRLLARAPPTAIVGAAHYLLTRHLAWERWEPAAHDAFLRILCRPEVADALVRHLASNASGPLAKIMQFAMKAPLLDASLPSLAQSAVSPYVRRSAYEAMGSGEVKWPIAVGRRKAPYLRVPKYEYATRKVTTLRSLDQVVRQAAEDRSPIVRRSALDLLIRHADDLTPFGALLERLHGDSSPAVRQRADFLLQKANAR